MMIYLWTQGSYGSKVLRSLRKVLSSPVEIVEFVEDLREGEEQVKHELLFKLDAIYW